MSQNRSSAVMAQRHEPHDSLDDFPTPPWGTRALLERQVMRGLIWEPAAGRGYMERTLVESGAQVVGSDIHDYGAGYPVHDFLFHRGSVGLPCPGRPDWIVTNPPYRLARDFAMQAFELATSGVALLCRLQWLEGGPINRRHELFMAYPPKTIHLFCDRLTMLKGRLVYHEPKRKRRNTATAYAWFVWHAPFGGCGPGNCDPPALSWIPPGTRARLEREEDFAR